MTRTDHEPATGQTGLGARDPSAQGWSLTPDASPALGPPSPLISVIVRTCNRQRFLREALQSLQAQTCQDFEVILVNDGGADVTDIVDEFSPSLRVSYRAWQPSRGRPQALNAALKEAQGTYIAYLDDDDIYYPDHLETLATALRVGDYQVAYTDVAWAFQRQTSDGAHETYERRSLHARDFDPDWLLFENYIPINAVMHARACIESVGPFDETFAVLEDWDLWIRLAQRYDFRHISRVTAEYRKRDDGSNICDAPGTQGLFTTTTARLFAKYRPERELAAQRLFEQMKSLLAAQVAQGEQGLAQALERVDERERERNAAVEQLHARTREMEEERRLVHAIEHDLEQSCQRADSLERDLMEAVQRTQVVERDLADAVQRTQALKKERDLLQAQLTRIHNSLLYRMVDLEVKFKEAVRRFTWKG